MRKKERKKDRQIDRDRDYVSDGASCGLDARAFVSTPTYLNLLFPVNQNFFYLLSSPKYANYFLC